MIEYVRKICRLFPSSVILTFLNYVFKLVSKFVLLMFVPLFLSDVEMGYWYTFISIAALTTFADLGFTTIITQFAAHEVATLSFNNKSRNFNNNQKELESIGSLFIFSIKWSGGLTVVASVIITIIGLLIFYRDNASCDIWLLPWIIYAMASATNFFIQVVLGFFEGCNQITISQKIKIINGIIINVGGALCLYFNCRLYSLAVPMLIGVIISAVQASYYYCFVIKRLVDAGISANSDWMNSIIKLLKKYAISWISGYFIFQIYSPLVFIKYGTDAAGKVGYLLTIIGAIVSVSNIWSYVSVPEVNILNERKEWGELKRVFSRNLMLMAGTFMLECFICCISITLPYLGTFFTKYIYSYVSFFIIAVGYLIQIIVSYIGVYLRANKEEPLMVCSIISAVISTSLTVILTHYLGVEFIFLGFTICEIIMLPIILDVKRKKELEWMMK